jgi:hypothetical protein
MTLAVAGEDTTTNAAAVGRIDNLRIPVVVVVVATRHHDRLLASTVRTGIESPRLLDDALLTVLFHSHISSLRYLQNWSLRGGVSRSTVELDLDNIGVVLFGTAVIIVVVVDYYVSGPCCRCTTITIVPLSLSLYWRLIYRYCYE